MSGRRPREEDPDSSIIPQDNKRSITTNPSTPARFSTRNTQQSNDLQILACTKGGRLVPIRQNLTRNQLFTDDNQETHEVQSQGILDPINESPRSNNPTVVPETIYENNEKESSTDRLARLTSLLASQQTPKPNARPRSIIRPSSLGDTSSSGNQALTNVWQQQELLNASVRNITIDGDDEIAEASNNSEEPHQQEELNPEEEEDSPNSSQELIRYTPPNGHDLAQRINVNSTNELQQYIRENVNRRRQLNIPNEPQIDTLEQENTMTTQIPISELTNLVQVFDGKLSELDAYIRNTDSLWELLVQPYTEMDKLRMTLAIKSKLREKAADAIKRLDQNNWPAIKTLLQAKTK